ncbi:hypothetical protein DFH29DRAFT_880926 [Suillus ampliporus]|nr:hypothetical protein DFH29DRAFT_880926 [Suillus ampliporus]
MFCRFACIGVGHQVQYDSLNIVQPDHAAGSGSTGVSHGDVSDDEDPEADAHVDFGDESDRDPDDDVNQDDTDDDVNQDDTDEDGEISEPCDSDVDDSDDYISDSEDGPAFKF